LTQNKLNKLFLIATCTAATIFTEPEESVKTGRNLQSLRTGINNRNVVLVWRSAAAIQLESEVEETRGCCCKWQTFARTQKALGEKMDQFLRLNNSSTSFHKFVWKSIFNIG